MNEVLDERERFADDFKFSTGGVVVGNVNLQDVQNYREEGLYVIRTY